MSEAEYALGYHCGITFAGLKVASLFRIDREAFRALADVRFCFAKRGFRFAVIGRSGGKDLLYVFHLPRLQEILFDEANAAFLRSCGYAYRSVGEALLQLRCRLCGGAGFPHEIGVFLGYPLDDVQGFIRGDRERECLAGYWKVYSEPEKKARLFAKYRRCSECICSKLREGKTLATIFRVI